MKQKANFGRENTPGAQNRILNSSKNISSKFDHIIPLKNKIFDIMIEGKSTNSKQNEKKGIFQNSSKYDLIQNKSINNESLAIYGIQVSLPYPKIYSSRQTSGIQTSRRCKQISNLQIRKTTPSISKNIPSKKRCSSSTQQNNLLKPFFWESDEINSLDFNMNSIQIRQKHSNDKFLFHEHDCNFKKFKKNIN